jgi:2-oxopent-4-enoate hydratase
MIGFLKESAGWIHAEAASRALADALETRTPIPPLSTTWPGLTVAGAYSVQQLTRSRAGGRVLGWKVGLTSRAVQRQLQVTQPDFGFLLDTMAIPAETEVPGERLLQPRVEGEIAFVLQRPLAGPGVTVADVLRATAFVLPAIEIIDSRIAGWKITYEDTIADNASSAAFVLGTTPAAVNARDWTLAGLALEIDGEVRSTGAGLACLGHPALAVAWLANTLGRLSGGRGLEAGDVVLSGALGPVVPVQGGEHVEVRIAGLGSVACRIGTLPPVHFP